MNTDGKATVLNSYFQSVFTSREALDLKQLCQKQCARNAEFPLSKVPSMPHISITTTGIAKLLINFKMHKAAGLDSISAMVLRSH